MINIKEHKKEYNVGWGFTKACNMNCIHCYNVSGVRSKDEVNLAEAKKIVTELKKFGIKTINYGTGECGLVPEFWKTVEYVHTKGIIQGLTTNGTSINRQTIGDVKKYMNDIDVSIDFSDRIRHNKFRGHDKAWDIAIGACDLLKKYKIKFSIVACINSKNCSKKELAKFIELIKKYNCDLRINWFKPTGRGKIHKELKLKISQFNAAVKYLCENTIVRAVPDSYIAAVLGIKDVQGCPCGDKSFRITPSGKVVPCVYMTREIDNLNIKNNKLDKILKSEPFIAIQNRKIPFCKKCEYYNVCRGGCASRAYLEYRTMDAPDPFCYKVNNIKNNPFKNIKVTYKKGHLKVHENYLCTMIVSPK
ncbi:MAG: radical SAM protein [Candidatus Woesearchaeota archaeon]